jgi:hypothetical protein
MRHYLAGLYLTAIDAFDLGGRDGRLSFWKFVLLLVLALGAFSDLSTTLAIAVLAASFGRTTFTQFLGRGSFGSATSDGKSRIRQYAEQNITLNRRRNEVLGIEETP